MPVRTRRSRPRRAPLALLTAAALAAALPLTARGEGDTALDATAVHLRQQALTLAAQSQAYGIVHSVTVEVGPRLAGSPGDPAAVAWAVRTMKRLGLQNVHTEPVTVPHWERGIERGRILAPYPQPLHLTALGGSVATPDGGLTAEVVEAASLDALTALPDDAVRGKIVFLDQKMERTRDGHGYGTAVPIRGRGPALAAKKGAVAVVIRSVGTGTHRFPHTGGLHYEEGVPKIPAAALAIPDADVLAAELASARNDGAGPVRLHLELATRDLGEAPSANVVGEVRGREKPGEVVLLGAHLDSWDLGTGAIDDGAGCAIVLAAAHLLAELPEPPRRTVRVVLFANEEFGLSGARAYAEAHAGELADHVLGAESDLGADRIWRFGLKAGPEGLAAGERIAELLAPLGIEWVGDQGFGGSDLLPMRPAGVPAAALGQDASRYFDYHHTADDTVDKIDPEQMAQNVAAYAVVAWYAAEMPGTFGRAPSQGPGE